MDTTRWSTPKLDWFLLCSQRWRSSIQSENQDQELTVAQIMNSLLPKSDWNWRKLRKATRPFKNDLNQIPYDYTVEVRNQFQGLGRIDRVPDELRMEVHDIVQETGIKTIPKKKKCKKAKWLSEEALQIAVKRREAKPKEKRRDINIWMQSSKE